MLSNVSAEAIGPVAERQAATQRSAASPLWAVLCGIAYPLAPALLYVLAAARLNHTGHLLALAAGVISVFAVPAVGVILLWRSAGANDSRALQMRGIGMLLVVVPPVTALSTSVAGRAGLSAAGAVAIWIGLWAVASAGVLWRSAAPRPLLPSTLNRRVRRAHRAFIVLLIAFVSVHVAVNLTALRDLAAYNEAAAWFRLVWRTPIGEPILIALLALQLVTGLALALDASVGRSRLEHLGQITAGLYIAAFLTSHTFAVAVLGRQLLNQGPAFTFASAGPGGLLSSAQGATLFPYYALSAVAVAVHLARPLRLWLVRRVHAKTATIVVGILVASSMVISSLLLMALVSPQ